MTDLKTEVYEISKKISKNKNLDITPEELASISLYSILNKGYSKGAYDYLYLSKNIYDEYILMHSELNNVYGFTNQTLPEKTIYFESDETIQKNSNIKFLKEEDYIYSKKLIEIIEKNNEKNNIISMLNEIKELNEIDDNRFLFEKFITNNKRKYKDNFTLLFLSSSFDGLEDEEEFKFESKNKVKNYSRGQKSEILEKFLEYKERDFILKILRGLSEKDIKEGYEDVFKFDYVKTKKIRENDFYYNNSKLKFLDEVIKIKNKDINNNLDILKLLYSNFQSFKVNIDVDTRIFKENNKMLDKDILNLYKEEIKEVEEYIFKKYPDLNNSFNDVKLNSNKILINVNEKYGESVKDINNFADYYYKNPSFNDIHLKNGYHSSASTTVISGIAEAGYSYFSYGSQIDKDEIYYENRNSLEITSIVKVYVDRALDNNYNYETFKNLKNIKIYSVDFLKREDFDIKSIKNSFENIIKDFGDLIIVHDFINSPRINEIDQIKLDNMMIELEKENVNSFFLNENVSRCSNDFRVRKDLKLIILKNLEDGLITYKEALEINKSITIESSIVQKYKDGIYNKKETFESDINEIIENKIKERKINNKLKV